MYMSGGWLPSNWKYTPLPFYRTTTNLLFLPLYHYSNFLWAATPGWLGHVNSIEHFWWKGCHLIIISCIGDGVTDVCQSVSACGWLITTIWSSLCAAPFCLSIPTDNLGGWGGWFTFSWSVSQIHVLTGLCRLMECREYGHFLVAAFPSIS